MIRLAVGCAALFAVGLASAEAEAGHWSFRRSYFSHDLPPAVARHYPAPESRSAYRRPYVHTTPEFSIRGGYRNNFIFMRSGLSTDVTVVREDWYQLGR
ncbi:MAG: hypothetical protein KDA79_18620 [Planctomycetaceae bacterium]|nr:hypothetical protein [Planctomycetaceae bacterium]